MIASYFFAFLPSPLGGCVAFDRAHTFVCRWVLGSDSESRKAFLYWRNFLSGEKQTTQNVMDLRSDLVIKANLSMDETFQKSNTLLL